MSTTTEGDRAPATDAESAGAGGDRGFVWAVVAVAAAALLVVPLLAAAIAFQLSSADAFARADAGRADLVPGLAAVRDDLIPALQDERSLAASYLLGYDEVLDLPVEDHGQARRATDEAIAGARADLDDDAAADVADAYAPALDATTGLAAVRASVDEVPEAERTIAATATADEVFARYTAVIDGLVAADESSASLPDDRELRQGLELANLSVHQQELAGRLLRAILLNQLGAGADASGVEALAADLARFDANQAMISARATGGYQPAVDALVAVESVRDLRELAAGALRGGQGSGGAVVDTTAANPSAAYAAFRDVVTTRVAERAVEVAAIAASDAARGRRDRWLAGAALAGVAVCVTVAVLAVLALRRRRAAGSRSHG
jgi:nitrate/nitrite sensing protein